MKPAQKSFAICSPHPICFIKQQYSLSHQHDLQITSRAGQACLLLQSGGFLAFTAAGRDMLSRQYLKGMLNNDLIKKRHNWVHLDIPQQMWGRQSIDRGPLVLLVINRESILLCLDTNGVSWMGQQWQDMHVWRQNHKQKKKITEPT